jgi:hypothetical protein
MQERRKAQRRNLVAYTQVFDLYGGHLLGYLGDLHLNGAMVIGQSPIAENTELTLAIELPDLPNIATPRITIPARTVWCEPDISPEFFNLGFEFKQVTEVQASLIEALICNYEFRHEVPTYKTKPSAE